MPGHDSVRFAGTLAEGRLFQIKAQASLAHFWIGTMTTEAVAGQYRLHILVEVELCPRMGSTQMTAAAARGCSQQGNRYHRGQLNFRGQGISLRTTVTSKSL